MSAGDSALRASLFAREIRRHVRAGSTVLEIGAGEGALAGALGQAGHRVIAIDPNPRGEFQAVATTFEDYDAGHARFDAVVAQFVLHHAGDLDAFVQKMADVLRPGGVVAIDDYGWERSDDASFRSERADLHTSLAMLAALDRTFLRIAYADHPYAPDAPVRDALGFFYFGKRKAGSRRA